MRIHQQYCLISKGQYNLHNQRVYRLLQEAALQALGYQTDFVATKFDIETAADPRDSIGLLREIHAAERLPIDEAIQALETIVACEPRCLAHS